MNMSQLLEAIDATECRAPGFYLQPVCETWLRRELPGEWFMRSLGVGNIRVIDVRAAAMAALARKREGAESRQGRPAS